MTIKNSASSEGGPIESSSDPAVEEGSDDNYDNVILRLKSLSIPEHPEDANLNEHCLAACAEAQRTVADENAKYLLGEWQQFDDSEAVIDLLLAEITDEIDLNDEPEEILEVTDDGNKEAVVPVEQPGTSKSEVMDAAMQALQFFAAAEMESVP